MSYRKPLIIHEIVIIIMVDGRPISITSLASVSVKSRVEPLTELENPEESHKIPSGNSAKSSSNQSIISVSRHVDENSQVRMKMTQIYRNFESFIVSIFIS